MKRIYRIILFIFASVVILLQVYASETSNPSFSSSAQSVFSVQYNHPPQPYPAYGGIVQTSKLKTTVKEQGIIGAYFKNPNTNQFEHGFEFPINRNVNYLSNAGLWVGGIVDNDTLVSTAICKEIYFNRYGFTTFLPITDFHSPYSNGDTASTILYATENENTFHSVFTDTFIPRYDSWSTYFEKHKPMGLHVTFKTYTKNEPPFTNIVLLDFTITNKSSKTINSAFVGMYVASSVYSDCPQDSIFVTDDLIGTFRDEGVAYVFDNDGELNISNCQDERASGLVALKTMSIYPPVTDTNFNWWTNWDITYAPQKKGTDEQPFRELSNASYGTPQGDSNRYYIMSHPEWDFDQYLTKQTTQNDTSWVSVDDTLQLSISRGNSPNFLLSLGPVDISPDSSIRTVFALIGTDLVHFSKYNYQNLIDENYDLYYNNLYFDVLDDNIRFAKILTDEYLNPLNKPFGFQETPLDSATYLLTWDNFVYPEVLGYKIYVKEIPETYSISYNLVRPDIDFETIPTEVTQYITEENKVIINNLNPAKRYIAVMAHMTISEEGNLSDPIFLGTNNQFNKPKTVYPTQQFTPIHPDYNITTLKWYYPENNNITYFKIYKTIDSISAIMRYAPFLYSQPDEIPFSPKECFEIADSTICYYALNAYDSVSGNIRQYTDSLVEENNYYWITAINSYGIESDLSHLVKAVKAPEITKDIVAIIGSTNDAIDYVYEDSMTNYYNQLLEGYNYDIFYWTDSFFISKNCTSSVCVNWEDLARYKLILINEYPSPKLLTEKIESRTKIFTKLADLGNNIAYFGIPTGHLAISLNNYANTVTYNEFSFERNYMGLDQTNVKAWFGSYDLFDAIDSLGGFNKALSKIQALPDIAIKPEPTFFKPFVKQLFKFENCIPFVPTFVPTENTQTLYTFQSAFPESSEQQGKPVGIMRQNRNNLTFTFGFHLWAMEMEPAKQLVRYLFDKQSKHYQTFHLPNNITLNQNYPNPFNDLTTINFSLPENSQVSIELFNVLGQKIKTILQPTELPIGQHSYSWDGKNEQGNTVSTGIYLYRLESNGNSYTKKMLYLK